MIATFKKIRKLTHSVDAIAAACENKEGISTALRKAKAKGIYKGRKPTIDTSSIVNMKRDGIGASQIARELNISRVSVYRALKSQGIVAA